MKKINFFSLGNIVDIRHFFIVLCTYKKRYAVDIKNNIRQNLTKEITTQNNSLCENHILKLPPKQMPFALDLILNKKNQ